MKYLAAALVLFACGDDVAGVPTDGSPDGAIAGNNARVRAWTSSLPNPEATVYFLAADSTVLDTKQTDAMGFATGKMEPDGFIVVGTKNTGTSKRLDIIAGVQPGDDLNSGIPKSATTSKTFAIDAPYDTGGNVRKTYLFSSCGTATLINHTTDRTTTMQSWAECSGSVEFLLVSVDDNNQALRTSSTTLEVTGTTITLPATAYTAVAPGLSFQLSNVPNGAPDVRLGYDGYAAVDGAITGTSADFALANLARPMNMDLYLVEPGVTTTIHRWTDNGATAPFAAAQDLASDLLPSMTGAAYDATSHAITWTETARGKTPTFATLTIGGTNTELRLRAPYTAGKIQLPVLPMYDGTDFTPPATTSFTIRSFQSSLPWSTFRADGTHATIDGPSGSVSDILVIHNGG